MSKNLEDTCVSDIIRNRHPLLHPHTKTILLITLHFQPTNKSYMKHSQISRNTTLVTTLLNVTPIPQSHNTPDETQRKQQKPIQQTQQQPPKDNIQTQPAEQQSSDSESETDSITTIPQPTLTPNEKRTLSSEEQQSFLYWRGQMSEEERHTLYPNQLYRYINEKHFNNKTEAEPELEMYFEKTEIEREYGLKTLYTIYKEEQDTLRQECRWNDKINNRL